MRIVTPWGTRASVDFLKARRLRRAALVALIGVCQCLVALPASAERLPGLSASFPADIGVGGKFSALRYSMSGSTGVLAFNPKNPTNPFEGDGDSYSTGDTLFSNDYKATLNKSEASGSAVGTIDANALSSATAAFGTLRGSAVVHLEGGQTRAHASTDVEFFDLIQIHKRAPGLGSLNFRTLLDVHGDVEGSGIGVAEVWIIDVMDHPPRAFELLRGPSYQQAAKSVGVFFHRDIGEFRDIEVGSRYWLYGRLHTQADREFSGFAGPESFNHVSRADFTHTVQVFIDPSPDSPDAFITSASGFNYSTPVPLPSSLVLALGALVAGFVGDRVRRRA